jgi:hypothetical protein
MNVLRNRLLYLVWKMCEETQNLNTTPRVCSNNQCRSWYPVFIDVLSWRWIRDVCPMLDAVVSLSFVVICYRDVALLYNDDCTVQSVGSLAMPVPSKKYSTCHRRVVLCSIDSSWKFCPRVQLLCSLLTLLELSLQSSNFMLCRKTQRYYLDRSWMIFWFCLANFN